MPPSASTMHCSEEITTAGHEAKAARWPISSLDMTVATPAAKIGMPNCMSNNGNKIEEANNHMIVLLQI